MSGTGAPAGLLYCTIDPVDFANGVTCPAYGAAHVAGAATKTFDANGDVLTSTDPDGDVTSYTYGSAANPGLPTVTTDPDGTTTTDTYDAEGEVLTQVVTGTTGTYTATTQYGYDSSGRRFCEVDPYEYSTGIRCPGTPPTTPPTGTPGYIDTIYNSNGQVASTTNPIGGTTQYAYDGSGNQYCSVSPTNYASGTRCPTSLPLTTPTVGSDSYLGATITTYDADNRSVQVTNPLGGITLTTYDAANNVIQSTLESNNATSAPNIVTENTYDVDNRLISSTIGYGSSEPATTLTNYDPDGNAFCVVSANAYNAYTFQCPAWYPAWIAAPRARRSLYSSTPTTAQANDVTTTFFNADGDQVQSTNPDVDSSIAAFDADGRTYCTVDPTNFASWLTSNPSSTYPYLCPSSPPTTPPTTTTGYVTTLFDHAGRTLSSTDQVGDTTSYAYDPSGHTTTTTDPRGKATTDCYYWESGTGQCAAAAPAAGGSPDDLYSVTTPATTADPSGEISTYTYLPGETAHVTTTPSGTTTDSYDANLDLTGVAYSATATGYTTPANQTYTYFADGSRHTMVDASGTTTYTEDANDDVTQQAFTAGSGTGLANNIVGYGYFTTGVEASVTYPTYGTHTSPQATYTYDALGNMASSTDWLGNEVTFSHDGDGNLTTQDNAVGSGHPTGTSNTTFTYDNADQNNQASSTLSCSGSNGSLSQSFAGTSGSRNPDGQVTQDSESYSGSCAGPASYQRNYSYDQAGRVVYQGTTAQGASPNNIIYDASGDPTQISSHDISGNFDSYTQTFDNAGETTGQSPISGSMGNSSTYSYDTLGAQTQTVAGSTTSAYGYNQAAQMTSYAQGSATATYRYTGDGLEASAISSGKTVWGSPTDVDSTRAIDAVTCTSSTFCAAVGASGYVTTYNGTSWTTPTDADSTRTLDAVSCTSATFCVAVDTSGYATIYNGTTWSTPTDIDSTRSVDAVDCTSTTFCVAVGASGYAATYNGTSWAASTDVDSTRTMDAVSCTSSTFCIAVDTSGYSAKYTGTWGTATDIDSTRSIDTVTCVSTTFCVAAGASGYATTYNGTSWSTATDADSTRTIKAVSCPTSSLCVAVDTSGYATTYNGASWSTPTDIDGSNAIEALSCASATQCEATDADGNVLTYNGTSWSTATNIDATRSINAVSCPTTSFCAATDGSGYAVVYGIAYQGWGSPTDVDSTRAIDAVTCTSSTFCAAVGASGYVTTYNGTSWTTPTDADSTRTLDAVSCTSATFCVAVDTSGYATIYNGTTWSTPTDIDSTRSVDAVDCTSTTFCVAVGASGYAATYNGTSWAASTDVDSTRTMDAVSCTSSTFCIAVDTSGYSAKYTGTWGTATDIDSTRSIDTVTCVSTTFCVAAGASGYATTYNGTSWSTATDADSTRTIKAVSCPTSSLCVAVDTSGYATTYNGASWSTPTDIDGSNAIEALSCASATQCEATDADGNVLTYNGTSWSTATNIDATRSINAVSCPTTSFCAATDGSGYAVVYHTLSTTTQLAWDTNGSLPLVVTDSTNDYIWGPNNEPVEQVNLSSSTPTYLTYTASDSSWLATNNAGSQVAFWRYDAFGNLATGSPDSPFGYSGQYADATTALVNDRARFYESQTGSFTTRDPAFSSTDQAYAYANADPINESDPTGLFWGESELDSIGAGLSGDAECLSDPDCLSPKGIANLGAGLVDQAAQTADHLICDATSTGADQYCPTWSVGSPFPCASQGSYQVGETLFFGLGLLIPGADEEEGAGAAATGAVSSELSVSEAIAQGLFITSENEALFWTGFGDDGAFAAGYADEHGGTTLSQLMNAKGILASSDEEVIQASRAFAQGARGTVRVLEGPYTTPGDGVFFEDELPLLIKNTSVTEIVGINAQSGSRSVLKAG